MARTRGIGRVAGRLMVGLMLVGAFASGLLVAHFRKFPYPLVETLVGTGDGGDGREARLAEGKEPGSGGRDGESTADRRPGLWHLVRQAAEAGSEPDDRVVDELADLPYMSGYESASEVGGVTIHDSERAYQGLNLVVSGHAPEAYLMDMRGNVVHRWRHELADVWPQRAATQDLKGFETFWRRAQVLPHGELLAIYDGIGLIKLDRDSNLVWSHAGGQHHDLFVDEMGWIHTLTRKPRSEHDRLALEGPIEEDFVTVLDAEGRVQHELSILESLLASDYASLLARARRQGDILHTNTIELMDGRFAALHPLYAAGNILVSLPRLNVIAVIDPRTERVEWALGGLWRFQHQPTVLNNGNMLVFDNTGHRGDSKVVEVEPLTQAVVWSYRGSAERRFTSYFLGSSQRLPNGNTLITESTAGRAFEVSRGGTIVWEFVNPQRAADDEGLIASLLEVVRLDRGDLSEEFASELVARSDARDQEVSP